jgi:FlaA1/EpsC-like NDP-sugar epimerase
VLLIDIFLIVLAYYLAHVIRFADSLFDEDVSFFSSPILLLVSVKVIVFYMLGLYRGMWRYTSYSDILNILKGTVTAAVIIIALLLYVNRFTGFSRSVFILDTLLTFFLISGHRVAIRYYYQNFDGSNVFFSKSFRTGKKKLLLVGAGDYAEKVLREIIENKDLPYEVVGLVDDDPKKTGLKIHGIPVFGLINDIAEHVRRSDAQEILIAIASISGPAMKRIAALCQLTEIPFKVLPGIGELIDGKVSVKTMRDISYADLLGREQVSLDQDEIGSYISDKVVLVTGAGGSIGSELVRQILRFSPKKLILWDSSEENLYTIQMQLIHEFAVTDALPVLGKVQDVKLLDQVFRTHHPAVVFHAAAYKHVPLLERNPWQAVNNNIFGSQLLIEAAVIYQVERFVLVSTDKAVRPTNVMGASKRLTELLVQSYGRMNWDKKFSKAWQKLHPQIERSTLFNDRFPIHNTRFVAVRFGNVIGSSGSVIPLFEKQIERGGPVTVTHPEITRYFMSIDEAAQLILQAGAMGRAAEIFILKMGRPVKIDHMARELIKLSGKEPDVEIEIKYTGLREGEKLYEELISQGEGIVDTHHKKIMVLRGDGFIPCSLFHEYMESLAENAKEHNGQAIKKTLKLIIPEYSPDTLDHSVSNKDEFLHQLMN